LAHNNTLYELRLYSTEGHLQYIFDTWRSLDYNLKINEVNDLTLTLNFTQDIFDLMNHVDYLCEVRRNISYGWYTEEWFFMRTPQVQLTTTGTKILTCYMRGMLDLIDRRWLAYNARSPQIVNTTDIISDKVNKVGYAGDVMKEFVNENAGPIATIANGRLRNGVFPRFTVSPPNGLGPIWQGARSYKALLATCQEIGHNIDELHPDVHDFTDFNVIYDNATNSFLFETYYPQLGVDRTATIVFNPDLGNVTDISYTNSRSEEVNAIIVNGPGQQGLRTHATLENIRKFDSPWNDRESVVDSRNQDTTAELDVIARTNLARMGATEAYVFTPQFNETTQYGYHFHLGDKVSFRFLNFETTKKLVQVHVNMSEGKELLQLTFADYLTPVLNVYDALRVVIERIQEVTSTV
jgi:hypothetical protein